MTRTLWDTTGSEVVHALVAERRASGAVSSGLALTLVTVVDEKRVGEAELAATAAAAHHPCRLIVVVRHRVDADSRLDAEVSIGDRFGPTEAIVLRAWGRLSLHLESVVLPLLAPDAPVVTWWHGAPPDEIATDPLGVLAERRVTDCAQASDPSAALDQRARDYAPGDTDLAWARATPWRSVLAASFDSLHGRARSARISAEAGNPSARLLAGWLSHRLDVPTDVDADGGPGITSASIEVTSDGEPVTVAVRRPDGRLAVLSRTGRPDRQFPMHRETLGDLLAEELRRLDADPTYAEALEAATGARGLAHRPANRRHVWRDPDWDKQAG